jgi:hypothetical protein
VTVLYSGHSPENVANMTSFIIGDTYNIREEDSDMARIGYLTHETVPQDPTAPTNSRVLLEKLIVDKLAKKFPAFYAESPIS